jgi:hypothetical protein
MNRILIVVWLLPLTLLAQGGPPILTDDPGTPGPNNWEINIAGTWERRGADWEWEAPLLDLNYGVGEHIQLKYELAYLISDRAGEGIKGGLGNSLIGVKWRFFDQDKQGVSLSTYPQLEFDNPTSSQRRHLVSGDTAFLLPVEIQRSFGSFGLNLEAAYNIVESDKDEWLYGLAGGYDATDRLELLVELHGIAERDFAEDELVFQLGLRQHMAEHFTLLAALGRGLRWAEGQEIKTLGYLGLQLTF